MKPRPDQRPHASPASIPGVLGSAPRNRRGRRVSIYDLKRGSLEFCERVDDESKA
ncbi:MAG: hypothetical protein AVDCRST_MAG01-01-3250 [uncultured Rubrobacteraceae bacterium]|uniref:Uncharacterized protein n=1 Tax=uncultured Rubrobacteraceae bacterium TaxID=349277 RepID=A0A6J4Q9T0_9ACTN|nr:MAG: hypothetical protein AVDCRST_MAG01-01-3250 [uncultured Rubrobacteraceae bacterium]